MGEIAACAIALPDVRDPKRRRWDAPLADYAAAMIYKLGADMVGHGHGLADQNRRFGGGVG
jgi:hypothetical protein